MTFEGERLTKCRCKILSMFLLGVVLSTPACAEPVPNSRGTDAPMRSARDADAPMKLNLLAGARTDAGSRERTTRIGSGSYLCTPAGFGQKSWCIAN